MSNIRSGSSFHTNFHFFGAAVLAIGIPCSTVLMSIGTMLLALAFLINWNWKEKLEHLRFNLKLNIRTNQISGGNLLIHLCLGFFALHFIALIYSHDLTYAMNDIRVKLPLLVLPLVLGARKPFEPKQLRILLLLYVLTLLVSSIINFLSYQHLLGNRTYDDIRGMSLFGSHIRYGIQIGFAAALSYYFIRVFARKWMFLWVVFILWFAFYTYYSQILSGVISLLISFGMIAYAFLRQRSKRLAFVSMCVLVSMIVIPIIYILTPVKKTHYSIDKLDKYTAQGNPYKHDLSADMYDEGKPIFIYVCEKELRSSWNSRSNLSYDSLDLKGYPLKFTLMRYLSSLDLRKDAEGVSHLTASDISDIESGIASAAESKSGLLGRIEGIRYQVHHPGEANGHSLWQRIEYWKTGVRIIRTHWLLGVGTGDVQHAFDLQYTADHSRLFKENRHRAHNSYLTAWISFGIIGFFVFLWMLIRFLKIQWRAHYFPGVVFILISLITFLIEDSLETQMGVSFFAYFYALFMTPQALEPEHQHPFF
jgi:hypothetical protein